jgi:hypothetical protein
MSDPTPAAYGAALLDRVNPGWHERINLADLDMSSACQCVLGQLYGWYEDGMTAIGLDGETQLTHGFAGDPASNQFSEKYWRLDEQWVREVAHRLIWDVEKVEQRRLRAAEVAAVPAPSCGPYQHCPCYRVGLSCCYCQQAVHQDADL